MAVADNDASILDSLRPIFPQLNDHVLSDCIRNVRQTVGCNPALIVPGCIEVLLAQQTATEVPLPGPGRSASPTSIDHDRNRINSHSGITDNEVIFVRSSGVRDDPRSSPSWNYPVINLIEEAEVTARSSLSASNNSATASPCSRNSTGSGQIIASRENSAFGSNVVRNPCSPKSTAASTSCADQERHQIPVVNVEQSFDGTDEALKNLRSLFPDVEENYLQGLVDKWSHLMPLEAINNACLELLETKDYPKKPPILSVQPAIVSKLEYKEERDYFKDFSNQVSPKCRHQCFQILQNEFKTIPVKHIRRAMGKFCGHYAACKRYLQEQLRVSSGSATSTATSSSGSLHCMQSQESQLKPSNSKDPFTPPKIKLLTYGRSCGEVIAQRDIVEELKLEIAFIKKYELSKCEEMDRILASSLNDKQYEEEGQKIECGCCYGDAAFEDMVQCQEGHLFCASCLMNYAKEAAFGQGKAALTCMSDGCDSTFPSSQLKKALPTNILEKYEDRVQEESLLMAQMEDFVRCPSCDFAVILPLEDKVLKCQNPSCGKETCRFCKEEWAEHFGLKCNEVEKSAQKDVRISYEEKMTMAKIRKCPKCGCEFTKSDGCNKMTCRCGTTMCYICRKPNIGYNHFCQHPKDPGKPCTKCKSCSLWTDPTEDDNRAVEELEKKALEAKRKFEEENIKLADSPAKKVKIC